MVRFVVLLALLSGLFWWLRGEEQRGRFVQADELFLDMMLANARDRFLPEGHQDLPQVVFLPMKEAERDQYAEWPPAAVDYQMILRGLSGFKPSVVVIVPPLHWPQPDAAMIRSLQAELLKMPSVVLTAGNGNSPASDALPVTQERLGTLYLKEGSLELAPALTLTTAPAPDLARAADLAVLGGSTGPGVPLLYSNGSRLRPSPALLGLMRAVKLPLSSARVVLGPGASLTAGATIYLPLERDGSLNPQTTANLVEQNALDLMTAGMLDGADGGVAERMGQGKVVVLGMDGANEHQARDQASALAHALALPRLKALGSSAQIIIWAVSALLGLSLLFVSGAKALRRAVLYLLLALVACFLAFQMKSVWFPPAIPALLLLCCGVYCRLFNPSPKAS
jgi:hypothetical protein